MRGAKGQLSDEEFIDRMRRVVERFHRWRPWLIGFHVIMLCVVLSLLFCFQSELNRLALLHVNFFGFWLGIVLGFMVGDLTARSVKGIFDALFGVRTETLLLKYHDELVQLRAEHETSMPEVV